MAHQTTTHRTCLIISFFSVIMIFMHNFAYSDNTSKFFVYSFRDNISIEIPNSWEIVKSEVMEQIDTATESMTGIRQGNNTILIVANCYTNYKKPSATVRLSIRYAETASQDDIKNLDDFSLRVYSEIGKKSVVDSLNKINFQGTIDNYKMEKVKIGRYYSLKISYISNSTDGNIINILHIINLDTKRIKLYLSYRDEEQYLKTIVEHIEKSLQLK